MKKIFSLSLGIFMILTLCSCRATGSKVYCSDDFAWNITIRNAEVCEELYTDVGIPQYDGSILDKAFDTSPSDGNVFVVLTMIIEKKESGRGAFEWEKLALVDSEGNAYKRMSDDSFLSQHAYNRLPGISLLIGENKGSICFEVPKSEANKAFTLTYTSKDNELMFSAKISAK